MRKPSSPSWPNAADRTMRNYGTKATRAKRFTAIRCPKSCSARPRQGTQIHPRPRLRHAVLYRRICCVKKSNEDGYLVGSRGSVGSSLAATIMRHHRGQPAAAALRLPRLPVLRTLRGRAQVLTCGLDLPKRRSAPSCGADLRTDGYDIPFEAFLGFNGDKVPDIDLNFSGVYQPRAHAYIRGAFRQGQRVHARAPSARWRTRPPTVTSTSMSRNSGLPRDLARRWTAWSRAAWASSAPPASTRAGMVMRAGGIRRSISSRRDSAPRG